MFQGNVNNMKPISNKINNNNINNIYSPNNIKEIKNIKVALNNNLKENPELKNVVKEIKEDITKEKININIKINSVPNNNTNNNALMKRRPRNKTAKIPRKRRTKRNNQDNYFIFKNIVGKKDYIYLSVCDSHGIEGHFFQSLSRKSFLITCST